jgi:hypothetical protein
VVPTVLAPVIMTPAADTSSKVGNLVLIGWVVIFVPLASLVALHFGRAQRQVAPGVPGEREPAARAARVG